MKKSYLSVGAVLTLGIALISTSCIGSFSLTNQLLIWNKHVGNKFVNELVFIAFCVIPVYEVTALADILVLNSVEFWSGSNPVGAFSKVVEGKDGKYLVECDGKGYTITSIDGDTTVRLEYEADEDAWAVMTAEGPVKFMTFIDDSHVEMMTSSGDYLLVELSEAGLTAYEALVSPQTLFAFQQLP